MDYLVDTNVLLRWLMPAHPEYPVARTALETLRNCGEQLYVTPQNLIEFWNVITRPANRNGFGLTPALASAEVTRIEGFCLLAPDSPDIYPEWKRLVSAVGVSGVQVHDARLVAVMQVHGLTHILTFNTADFRRYAGITVVHPASV